MLDNLTEKQKKIVIILAIVVTIGMIYFIYNKIGTKETIDENILISSNILTENEENIMPKKDEDMIVIHMTGAIKNPGIVRLQEGSRMEDAIKSAGGLTENADITEVNLAYVLEDGLKIRIPYIGENKEEIITEDIGENVIEEINEEKSNKTKKVNINRATQNELETLPGIGVSLASRIIEYREKMGNFSNIEDIKNVSGVGESKFNNIKDFIDVK